MTTSALELVGMLVACGGAATAVVARDSTVRHLAMALALVTAPALMAGDVWEQGRIVELRSEPLELALAGFGLLLIVAGLAAIFRRLDWAFPVAVFATIALRVPLQLGDQTSNLLVPLYLVIASGFVASVWAARARMEIPAPSPESTAVRWLRYALAATLVLYGVQTAYSEDVSNAIENAAFFLVPFAVLFALLAQVRWTRRVLTLVLGVIAVAGVVFASIGIGEYLARDLLLNQDLLDANQNHLYFRVNSLFRDPNVFGRYLALAILALAAFCAYARRPGWAVAAALAAVIQLAGLGLSFSLSSFSALLAGLVVATALRFGWRWGAGSALSLVAAAAVFSFAGGADRAAQGPERGLGEEASGRVELFEGGVELFERRPGWGFGSGSFGNAFANHVEPAGTTNSHAEPLTVAAEQGVIGLLVYVALLGTAVAVLFGAGPGATPARCGAAAALVAMFVHSIGYAAFATDPITWALLALGVALRSGAIAE